MSLLNDFLSLSRSVRYILIIGFAILFAIAGYNDLQAPEALANEAPALVSPTLEPVSTKAPYPEVVVHSYLRQTLHDWDSYEDMGFSEPEIVEHNGNNVYHVLHRYRAKNGFGAQRLIAQDFYYSHGGEMIDISAPR